MTGHSISTEQSQEFLSTMHTMIDDLDTISSNIDENTYLRLVNGLQRLYTIHNSSNQSPNSVRENINQRHIERYQENFQDNNEVQMTRVLAQHYGRVNDISGIPINNDINTINADAINANAINANANTLNNYITNYNTNNENNQALNRENARISYTALYTNASEYWNQARFREFRESVIAR
jgi:hypothetical protein